MSGRCRCRSDEEGGLSLSVSHVCAGDVLGIPLWPPSRPQTLGARASQGRWPHLWGALRGCPALATPRDPPCVGCRVLRLLGAQVSPDSCAGPGAPWSISSGGGHVRVGSQEAPLPPGCPRGFYGKHCAKKCHCANRGRCHRLYGACLCDPGLYGRFCHLGESHCPLAARVRGRGHNVGRVLPAHGPAGVGLSLFTDENAGTQQVPRLGCGVCGLKATSSGLHWPPGCLSGWAVPAPARLVGGLSMDRGRPPSEAPGHRAPGHSWQQVLSPRWGHPSLRP